jgi:death on curing protein
MSSFWYLTLEATIELQEELIDNFGGTRGIRDKGIIESAIESPKHTFEGEDMYPTIFDKAACYAFQLSQGQGFVDGNKRIAVLSALTFLDINEHPIISTDSIGDQLFAAMHEIAEGKMERDELADLFRNLFIESMNLNK